MEMLEDYIISMKSNAKDVCHTRTTDHGQATGKLYHLRLRIECTLFVIYKAGREPTPYGSRHIGDSLV
jgi:hypothetical protein